MSYFSNQYPASFSFTSHWLLNQCPIQGDAPDDLFFKATPATKRLRKSSLTVQQIRRFARRATKCMFNMNRP